MKITASAASVAILVTAIALSALAEPPRKDGKMVSAAVHQTHGARPSAIAPAYAQTTFLVPEPRAASPDAGTGDSSAVIPTGAVSLTSELLQSDGQVDVPLQLTGLSVTGAATAETDAEDLPSCANCRGCRARVPCRSGWWHGRIKPCLQRSHWGYADQFDELPVGTSLCAHMRTQIVNGMKARMVLYRYDFYDETAENAAELNPRGKRRLEDIAGTLQEFGLYPIVIEPVPQCPGLEAARRDHVLKVLQESSFAVPEQWVVVAVPDARGLAGEEAVEIHANMITQTKSGPQAAAPSGTTQGVGISLLQGQSSAGQ